MELKTADSLYLFLGIDYRQYLVLKLPSLRYWFLKGNSESLRSIIYNHSKQDKK